MPLLHFKKWDVSVIYRATDVQVCSFLVPLLPLRRLVQTDCCFVWKLIPFGNQILTDKVHGRVSVVQRESMRAKN